DPDFFDSNGLLKGLKRELYEGGIRVPMIARWPGKINAGGKSDHISAFWDFLPTACDIAEITSPENIDGISFLPAMIGGEQAEHDYLYWEFMERNGRQGIRKGNWKAVKYDMSDNPEAPIQLYDLSVDIGEENNIASEHPEIVSEMEDLMKTSRIPSDDFKFNFEKEK
ncbi:MAG: sulfatase-like hydrolase/transferase, partial [Cyclobacteriaceae bacterium]|nr:sulfatase-like hydrolase/transferase [Cyclobacteriaceae bacterium]